jgi:nucleoside-diphosphate-sugar epimerase
MTVLITGASGFVGRTLCKRLMADGYQVRGAVRSAAQITVLPSMVERVQVGDIGLDTDWSKVLGGINRIVHLAARVHVMRENTANPILAIREVNVKGTECLAQQAIKAGVKRFVYLSSVKVHGEGRTTAYNEKDDPGPMDPYAKSKWEAEKILCNVVKETGMEIVILRSPLVYGPHVKANFLRLLEMADSGIPLPLRSINNRRSFIYLNNLVDAIITCMKHPKAAGQTYFVSDGEDISTPELIRRISSSLGKPTRLFPFPPVMLKMVGIITGKSVTIDKLLRSLTIDCSKICRELGWQAPFSMERGLKETGDWYMKKDLQ